MVERILVLIYISLRNSSQCLWHCHRPFFRKTTCGLQELYAYMGQHFTILAIAYSSIVAVYECDGS